MVRTPQKQHFDELRRTDLTNNEDYCTVDEIAKTYGMTTSNVCIIVKKSDVKRKKFGVKWLLLRTDIERIMAETAQQSLKTPKIRVKRKLFANDCE